MENMTVEKFNEEYQPYYKAFIERFPDSKHNYEFMFWIQDKHREFRKETGYGSIYQEGYEDQFLEYINK